MAKQLRAFFFLAMMAMLLGNIVSCEAAKKVVAVMPMENISGYAGHQVASIMTEQMVQVLQSGGNYTVVERNQLEPVLRELGFQMSGAVDMASAVDLGKMAGAEYSVVGTVTRATVSNNPHERMAVSLSNALARGFGLGGSLGNTLNGLTSQAAGRYRGYVTLSFKFINNKTGEVVLAEQVDGSKSGNEAETALLAACRDASNKAMEKIQKKNPFTAVIIDVEGDTIYIDQGTDSGVRAGEVFHVVKESKPIMKDGRIIAMKYIPLGKVKVKEVNAEYAICRITSQTGIIVNGALVKRGQ